MRVAFSASENVFYPLPLTEDFIEAGVPEDLIEVPEEVFAEFAGTPPEGKIRGNDDQGRPAWVPQPPPSKAQLVRAAEARKQGALVDIDRVTKNWHTQLALGIILDEDKAKLITWMKYAQAIDLVNPEDAPNITWPERP